MAVHTAVIFDCDTSWVDATMSIPPLASDEKQLLYNAHKGETPTMSSLDTIQILF